MMIVCPECGLVEALQRADVVAVRGVTYCEIRVECARCGPVRDQPRTRFRYPKVLMLQTRRLQLELLTEHGA